MSFCRDFCYCKKNNTPVKELLEPGDYLLNDLTTLKYSKITDNLKSKVIGVCVCSNDVLPDGKARFCGLEDMKIGGGEPLLGK